MKKGEIYLADFGKSKDSFSFGKKRPVIVFQTDKLNFAIDEGIYNYVLVIPLSTQNDIVTEEFRCAISPREQLHQKSFAVCNSLCFLRKEMLFKKLAVLDKKEILEIEKVLKNLFDMAN